MDLKQLENIVVISEEQSLSRAAERLFISQPALSQQLTKLEAQLGTPLFYRGTRLLTLTPAGSIYVKGAREILAIRKKTYSDIENLATGHASSFSVGVSANRSSVVLSGIYPMLLKKHPTVSVQIVDHTFPILETMLLNEKLDLTFTLLSDGELVSGVPFSHASLTREPMHLALSRKHPLAPLVMEANEKYVGIDIAQFQGTGFALSPKKGKLRTLADNVFASNNFYPTVLYEVFSAPAICSVVEQSNLCTILPVGYLVQSDNLIHAPITPQHFAEFSLCWNKSHKLSPAEETFILLCQEYCHENIHIPTMNPLD